MPTRTSHDAARMPLAEHLRELRNRLVKAVGAILLGTVVAALFYKQLIGFLIDPLPGCAPGRLAGENDGGHCGVISLNGLLSPFTLALKVSITAGVVAASPVWLYQLWAFVAPGLHRNEKKYTLFFLGAGIPLFLSGAAVAYGSLPTTARVLISFTPDTATSLLPVDDFLDLATRMVIVFGLSFELPVLLVLLNLGGVITARRMTAWWRGMLMGIAVFAALATPSTDPLSMLLLAAPISALYLAACVIAWCNDRRRKRTGGAEPGGIPQDTDASLVTPPRPEGTGLLAMPCGRCDGPARPVEH
jgi:sec-independent protein translocase protein TatC